MKISKLLTGLFTSHEQEPSFLKRSLDSQNSELKALNEANSLLESQNKMLREQLSVVAKNPSLHPSPEIDRLVRIGFTEEEIICSAGQTGFYIDQLGDYWKYGSLTNVTPKLGNILGDHEFIRTVE